MYLICFLLVCAGVTLSGQAQPSAYVLGPEDQLKISVLDVEEIGATPLRIDLQGILNVPLIGRVQAGGLTVEQLETQLVSRLHKYVKRPQITIGITEFRSQPVSVVGAVNKPGVHQLQGRKTLIEVLSLAEGLRNDAGNTIKLTRQKMWGAIPLPTAVASQGEGYSVAEIAVNSIMEARNPAENIQIMPNDVISVPRAALVYVVGNVRKSGGFVLGEKNGISALQALALAEGLDRGAAPKNAKIFRTPVENGERIEIAVDLKKLLSGKGKDIPMYANDVLFVPNSASKAAAYRALESALQLGTGVIIYRR
jgi:polysaccharide export outer membrane protein